MMTFANGVRGLAEGNYITCGGMDDVVEIFARLGFTVATGPVLIVPDEIEGPLGKEIVVAYDGSRAARRAMASFAASGLAQSRNVHVASVDDSGEQAWMMATAGVKLLGELDVVAEPSNIVSAHSSVDALAAYSRKLGAGLIVMGAFAHNRIAHLFHGSVTRGLVERTTIPLYLQH